LIREALKFLVDLIVHTFAYYFYLIYKMLLMILEGLEYAFNLITGIAPVYYKSGKETTLLMALFTNNIFQTALAIMIFSGFALCFLFALIATVKSTLDLSGDKKKSIGNVLRHTGRSMFYLAVVPMLGLLFISLSGIIFNTVDDALTQGRKTTVARTLFCITTLDALDDEEHPETKNYNLRAGDKLASDFGIDDKYRKTFLVADEKEVLPKFYYTDDVDYWFEYTKLDFVVGFIFSLYFIVILTMVLFVFLGRVYDVLLLLIIEPFFISTMPLDEGKYFKKWSEMFIGKLFSGFGMVAGMRIYLSVTEMLFTRQITFIEPGSKGEIVQNYILNLLFMAGGAFALKKIGPYVTQILSYEAASNEQMAAQQGLQLGNKITGTIGNIGGFGVKKLASAIGGAIGNPNAKAAKGLDPAKRDKNGAGGSSKFNSSGPK
ncbi:MAG: hypothetical protein K6F99_06090, partial [Lachnospiraceae bacterium]|nr:hypothetical protein [Lachnospiraceae bacterium]